VVCQRCGPAVRYQRNDALTTAEHTEKTVIRTTLHQVILIT